MKKSLLFFIILIALMGAKIIYDVYALDGKYQSVQAQAEQQKKQNDLLNDQLIALQRQQQQATSPNAENTTTQHIEKDALFWIGQRLNLVEFALQQQQYALSLGLLAQLHQELAHYDLAIALKQSLAQVIEKDQQLIQQAAEDRQAQAQKINQVLQQLDQQLQVQMTQSVSITNQKQSSFWSTWFQLEKVEVVNPQLMQRQWILKEAQSQLFVARQFYLTGAYQDYQQELDRIHQRLKSIPEPTTERLMQQIEELKAMPMPSSPQLNTRALLGN